MANVLLFGVETGVLLILVAYLVRFYKDSHVTWDVQLITYISWLLAFAGTLLLPYDISVALIDGERSKPLDAIWNAIYWSTFLLAWIILPIHMRYHMSGRFSIKGKMMEALKANAISYAVCFVLLIIFIIYMVATVGADWSYIVGFMMALSNTYGVVLIVLLLGNGLVSIPRRLWDMGNPKGELDRLYMMAPAVESMFHDARFELEDCELEAKEYARILQSPAAKPRLRQYMDIIQEREKSFVFHMRSISHQFSQKASKKDKTIDTLVKADLVSLHARLIAAQMKVGAAERRWKYLVFRVKMTEDLLNGTMRADESSWCEMREDTFEGRKREPWCLHLGRVHDHIRLFWRSKLFRHFARLLGIVCAAGTFMIFWGLLIMASAQESPIGAILVGLSDRGAGVFIVQAGCFGGLFYMSLCTFYTMFRLNLGWSFTLQGNQQSPATSLLFNATYISRLQFSLGYIFLLSLNVQGMALTSFQNLLSNMEIVPLFGTNFTVYAPIIAVITGVFSLLNIYARFLKFVGIDSEDAVSSNIIPCRKPNEDDLASIEEGKKLVASQLRILSAQLMSSAANNGSTRDTAALLASSSAMTSSDSVPSKHSDSKSKKSRFADDSDSSSGDVELGGSVISPITSRVAESNLGFSNKMDRDPWSKPPAQDDDDWDVPKPPARGVDPWAATAASDAWGGGGGGKSSLGGRYSQVDSRMPSAAPPPPPVPATRPIEMSSGSLGGRYSNLK